jgi:hypothetical protein
MPLPAFASWVGNAAVVVHAWTAEGGSEMHCALVGLVQLHPGGAGRGVCVECKGGVDWGREEVDFDGAIACRSRNDECTAGLFGGV